MHGMNGQRWFLAGTVLGAVGAYMGTQLASTKKVSRKRVRAKAASMAGKMSREAGHMLGAIGESFANRLR